MSIPILVIAAGASRRLGQAKQLLPFRGTFLLKYILKECINAAIGPVYVVLGAHREQIAPKLADIDCQLIDHPNWAEGMGSSIAQGVRHIDCDNPKGVLIVLGDQPFFSKKILQLLVAKQIETQTSIILSKYEKGIGPPSFFEAKLLDDLRLLEGDDGAKAIVKKHFSEVHFIPFEKGHLDIDKEEDLGLLDR